jgi:hypothetical protein
MALVPYEPKSPVSYDRARNEQEAHLALIRDVLQSANAEMLDMYRQAVAHMADGALFAAARKQCLLSLGVDPSELEVVDDVNALFQKVMGQLLAHGAQQVMEVVERTPAYQLRELNVLEQAAAALRNG